MTSPRIPLFQRKAGPTDAPGSSGGKPAITIAIGHGKPSDDSSSEAADREAGNDATCPNCGCVFNPDTGEVTSGPDDAGAPKPDDTGGDGGDLSSKIAAMMQGGANGGQ